MTQDKTPTIPKLPLDSFCWQQHRAGHHVWHKLGVRARYWDIVDQSDVLREYAIGYIEGERLYCQPKVDEVAVMFLIDDVFGWTHLRREEFDYVFRQHRLLHLD